MLLALPLPHAAGLTAQAAPAEPALSPTQAPARLTVEALVTQTLAGDPGLKSAILDWQAAGSKTDAANLRRLPSLSGFFNYQYMNELPPTSISFGGTRVAFPATQNTYSAFGANLQYPVFAGFRIHEAAALAGLQADGKLVATDAVRNALAFEARRAYWETLRTTLQVSTLEKNLELASTNRKQTNSQFDQGMATASDRLNAEQRWQQADQDLGDALSLLERWQLVLANLRGQPAAGPVGLDTGIDEAPDPALAGSSDEKALIEQALRQRPETRSAAIAAQAAGHSVGLAAAPLYPTVVILGNLTDANPNQRTPYSGDVYTLTWSAGVQVAWDIGAIPSAITETQAAEYNRQKAESDIIKQANAVSLDVRTCLLTLKRLDRDLGLMQGLVNQAAENLRVMDRKYANGLANEAQIQEAQLLSLRSELAVASRKIDLQIARADLLRSLGLSKLPPGR
jgi:outer membrane protein TolC